MDIAANPPTASGTSSSRTSSSGTSPANRAGELAPGTRSGARLIELPRPPFSASNLAAAFGRGFEKLRRKIENRLRRQPKSLFVSETAALGERRSVSVVQFERQRFLIGCGPTSIALLARLPDTDPDRATASVTSAELPAPGGHE